MNAPVTEPAPEPASERRGDWIPTFTGRAFWPLDPRADEIHIADIAHALAHQCRYAGHCRRFYSVAEHCVLLSHAVSPEDRLWALLHDASEAYLVDLPRPVKRAVVGYAAAEAAVMLAVCARFGLDPAMPRGVQSADDRIPVDELAQNMPPMPIPIAESGLAGIEPLGVTLQCWTPVEAEFQFMTRFDVLTGGGHGAMAPFTNPAHFVAGGVHG